ncbi:hypothetical protein [Microbacterium sp. LMI1-1-1.1]|uniref:hypothetical protein n=1 Tax=Microbacterium sp. LMI1-1-1.1 TaxID=3135223 RepID=UPI00346621A6
MNTTLSRVQAVLAEPPVADLPPMRSLSVAHRLALRVSVWLLLRTVRRVRSVAASEVLLRARRNAVAEEQRRLAWERAALLTRPRS